MDAGVPLATIQRWLGHANIAQTSTYLGASLGNDERDMRAFEAAIGRPAPLTQTDVFARPTPVQPIPSDPAPREDTQQDLIDLDPIGAVHLLLIRLTQVRILPPQPSAPREPILKT